MNVRLHNSLTNKIEEFIPIIPGKVSIYVCGPTVYNYVHVGNLRPVIVFDVLRRLFLQLGYEVTYVSNFTDIDDKIIAKASLEGKTENELAEFYIKAYQQDVRKVNSQQPTFSPRVTQFIPQIIDFISLLIKLDAAYVIDGDVYFRVASVKNYGTLSKMNIDELIVGARIEENLKKESPLDFALWKKSETGITFDTPWGKGRPGWHTECVVMVNSLFKKNTIDIHAGGFDLKFPHHDNEIAQSMAANGTMLARYWIHNGFINLNEEKMSKSLGNVVLAKDAIQKYGANQLRLLILQTHYRLPVNLSEEIIKAAGIELKKMENAMRQLSVYMQLNRISLEKSRPILINPFLSALSEDINTANALTEVFNTIKETNAILRSKEIDKERVSSLFFTLKTMFSILGLDIEYPILSSEDISLFFQYQKAKEEKDFALSDELRERLIYRKII